MGETLMVVAHAVGTAADAAVAVGVINSITSTISSLLINFEQNMFKTKLSLS